MTIAHLSGEDVRRFSELVQGYLAARGSVSASDQELEALRQLVSTYHAARVLAAITDADALNPGLVTIDQLSASLELHVPRLALVMDLLDSQAIIPYYSITSKTREDITNWLNEFPNLDWWQEAVRRAKLSTPKAGLGLVAKILGDYRQNGSWEKPKPERMKRQEVSRDNRTHRPATLRDGQVHPSWHEWDKEITDAKARRQPVVWDEEPI